VLNVEISMACLLNQRSKRYENITQSTAQKLADKKHVQLPATIRAVQHGMLVRHGPSIAPTL
jgi:hypothetical protein